MATRKEYWEVYRYKALKKRGFLSFEAKALKTIPFRISYMRFIMRERRAMLKPYQKDMAAARRRHESTIPIRDQFRAEVHKLYADNGWVREDPKTREMKSDVWTMLRAKRREAIAQGKYDIPKGKSHHKQSMSEAELAELTEKRRKYRLDHRQQIRDYARQYRAKPDRIRMWIKELDAAIAKETDPAKREQLERQKARLELRA